jgi:hypothetical protein
MDMLNTRPTWLGALLPLLMVWQYGDRDMARGELYRMALSADAAAHSAKALQDVVDILDNDGIELDACREELRSIVKGALLTFTQLPPCAPVALAIEHRGRLQ